MTQSHNNSNHDSQKTTNQYQNNQNYGSRGRGCSNRGGISWNNRNNNPQCQLFKKKFDYTTMKCYSLNGIFDQNRMFPQQHSNNPNGFHPQFGASSLQHNPAQMTVMLAASDLNQDNGWYPDSGATNHLINNFNNLTDSSEYSGGNHMQVVNGTGLTISHRGYLHFLLPLMFFILRIFFMFLT